MPCKICVQLEQALTTARKPDPADSLRGLTEAGLRNLALQRKERLIEAELNLEKHREVCRRWLDRPAF